MEKEARYLTEVEDGETVKLISIEAGRALNSRLASMGIVPNVKLKVLSNGHPGPFVVNVKGTKMMLGRGIAHKIRVQ